MSGAGGNDELSAASLDEFSDADEEPVLPMDYRNHPNENTNKLDRAIPREFGHSKIYDIEEGMLENSSNKAAVPSCARYFFRGKGLAMLNMIEYYSLIQLEKKITDTEPVPDLLNSRRIPAKRFEFDTDFILQPLYRQSLVTKQSLPFVVGKPPPSRPLARPERTNGETDESYNFRLQKWRRHGDRFAKYYLLLFRPTGALDTLHEENFTYAALEKWVEYTMKHDRTRLSEFRLLMLDKRLNGMSISKQLKKLFTAFRGRDRTLWNDEQKYGNMQYFGWKRNKKGARTRNVKFGCFGVLADARNSDAREQPGYETAGT